MILPVPFSPHKPFSTQLRTVTTIFTCLSQLNSLLPLSVDSKNFYKKAVIASNLYICIRPSMSKFQLILIQCYWYISFLNTPINLSVMAKKSRSQGMFHLTLLENATDTFIESFIHSRTKIPGSNMDCHSLSYWQGPRHFAWEVKKNIM